MSVSAFEFDHDGAERRRGAAQQRRSVQGGEPRSPRSQRLLAALAPGAWSTPPPGELGGRRAACFCCALPALLSAEDAPRNTLRPGVGFGYRGYGWSLRQVRSYPGRYRSASSLHYL